MGVATLLKFQPGSSKPALCGAVHAGVWHETKTQVGGKYDSDAVAVDQQPKNEE